MRWYLQWLGTAPRNQTAWFPTPSRPSLCLWTWTSYLTSLCLIFFFYTIGIIVATACGRVLWVNIHEVLKTGGPQEGNIEGSVITFSSSSLLKFSELLLVRNRHSMRWLLWSVWGRGGGMFNWTLYVEKDGWHLFTYKYFINTLWGNQLSELKTSLSLSLYSSSKK